MPLTYFQPSQVDSTFNGYLRNRIINGAMMIDQRNAGASVTPNNQYTLDRWQFLNSQTGKFTLQQNAGGVTPVAGFTNYLGVTSTSAYSVLSTDYFVISQPIEGLNVYDLAWGTASASTVTLSFWVRSSLTGTFGGAVRNSAANRAYPFTYTIIGANTWEYKTVQIPGDTTGTWLTTNGVGIQLFFDLGTGATYRGTAGAWTSSSVNGATGSVNVVGTNGATWYVTGIQLEDGAVATPFERRMYPQELTMCYRYYRRYLNSGATYTSIGMGISQAATNINRWGFQLDIPMRASPTLGIVNSVGWDAIVGGSITAITAYNSANVIDADLATSGLSGGGRAPAKVLMTSTGYVEVVAEL